MKAIANQIILGFWLACGISLFGFFWSYIIPLFKKLIMALKVIPV